MNISIVPIDVCGMTGCERSVKWSEANRWDIHTHEDITNVFTTDAVVSVYDKELIMSVARAVKDHFNTATVLMVNYDEY